MQPENKKNTKRKKKNQKEKETQLRLYLLSFYLVHVVVQDVEYIIHALPYMQGKVFYANRGSRVGGERLKGEVEKRERERGRDGEGSYRVLRYLVYLCSAVLCFV